MARHSQLQGATQPAPNSSVGWDGNVTNCRSWVSIDLPLPGQCHTRPLTLTFSRAKGIGSPAIPEIQELLLFYPGTIPDSVASPVLKTQVPSIKIVVLCPVASKKPRSQVVYKPNHYQLQQMKEEMQCLSIDWRWFLKFKIFKILKLRWQRFLARSWYSAKKVLMEHFQQEVRFFSLWGLFLLHFSG